MERMNKIKEEIKMANKIFLTGRLVRDPEVRYSQGENATCVARYTLASDRKYSKADDKQTDFINCVAFGKSGEFAEKYLKKGIKILVTGRIQTGSYKNKDGQTVYTTDVVVEEHEFCEGKKDSDASSNPANDEEFMTVPDGQESLLPF